MNAKDRKLSAKVDRMRATLHPASATRLAAPEEPSIVEKPFMNLHSTDVAPASDVNLHASRLVAIGELAASVAHELNNAFGTVTLRLEGILACTAEDDPRRHALEIVDREVERMTSLVANLLEFARASRGQVSTVDVCDEVNRTIELTTHHLARAGVKVITDFAAGVPLIQADRQQIRQVLLNLFTNAVDAMPAGGILRVRVDQTQLSGDVEAVVIEVTDNGVGIPPDILPRVTEAFFTTKAEGKGTGLGLSICQRIVHNHGGFLDIQSHPGNGTTVSVRFPILPETSPLHDTEADPRTTLSL